MIAQEAKLKLGVGLLLFPAVFVGLGAGLGFAQDANSRPASAMSANAAVKSDHAEKDAGPAGRPEPKEEGLTQDAVEIIRIFSGNNGIKVFINCCTDYQTTIFRIICLKISSSTPKTDAHGRSRN